MVDGTTVSLPIIHRLSPIDVTVPGDPSSAAFFAALAVLVPDAQLRLTNVCLNPTRIGFFNVLQRMGALVRYEDQDQCAGEPIGTIIPSAGTLHGVQVGGDEIPTLVDELPMLACLATRAEGETVIHGAAELRVKESDRIAVVVQNLRKLGASAEELPDGMRIVGTDAHCVAEWSPTAITESPWRLRSSAPSLAIRSRSMIRTAPGSPTQDSGAT